MAQVAKRRGRYVLDFFDNEGKRKWITLPEGTLKKDAERKLREILDQIDRGNYITKKTILTFKTVARSLLKAKEMNIRSSTWSVYDGHVRNHFNDLEKLKINLITTARIERYIGDRQKQGMHILTLRKILVTLNQIMAYAVRHKYIDHNPVRDAERPRGNGDINADAK